uniref:Uncharacterized protein n=1 Tax=Panagrolaimus davidi TaxID=227884 RepID=A0A914PJ39_9BILA
MESPETNPKYRCCCGLIHVVTVTKAVCIFVLLEIGFLIYKDPKNLLSYLIIATLIFASLLGSFIKKPMLIFPLCWILTLVLGGSIIKIIVTIAQYIFLNKAIIWQEVLIEFLTIIILFWLTFILKSCYNYFKWIKSQKISVPLKAMIHLFENVMPKNTGKQEIVLDEAESEDESNVSADRTTEDSSSSGTSEESQADNNVEE